MSRVLFVHGERATVGERREGSADGLPLGLMVTGPLWDDLGVLQACHAYEEAASLAWPSAELSAALAKAEGAAGPEVKAKIRPLK